MTLPRAGVQRSLGRFSQLDRTETEGSIHLKRTRPAIFQESGDSYHISCQEAQKTAFVNIQACIPATSPK